MNAINEKLVNALLSKYLAESTGEQKGSIELEIRLKDINKESFESIYNAISADGDFTNPRLECSVNIISENIYERNASGQSNEVQYIRKIIFEKGAAAGDTYMQKMRLIKAVIIPDYVKYAIGLAREIPSREFKTSVSAVVRFKARVSWDYFVGLAEGFASALPLPLPLGATGGGTPLG